MMSNNTALSNGEQELDHQLGATLISDDYISNQILVLTPKRIGVEKNLASVTFDCTYEHSMTFVSPLKARHRENANLAPANAIDRVADPVPAFAFTTSVPASWKHTHFGYE